MRKSILLLILALAVVVACHFKKKDDPVSPDSHTEPVMDSSGPYPIIKADGLQYHTGLLKPPPEIQGLGDTHVRLTLADCDSLPAEFDLRKLGLVSEIRDQGNCGSCWAFSKTNSLESALLGIGKKLDLAEQELVSCDKANYGCGGGFLDSYKYQINHGQGLESDFPYTASDSRCKAINVAAKGVSFQYVGTASRGPTEKELKCALYTYKTVPWITVGATSAWGSPPSNERTAYTRCGSAQTNHAVGVVGWWTDSSGKTQFIMKNSWGTSWGDKGYMSLPLGCNSFGEEVAFIEVPRPTPPPPTPTPIPPTPQPTNVPTPPPTPTVIPPTPQPTPCVAPKVKLPAEVQILPGTEVMIGVKAEPGVEYSWFAGGMQIPEHDSMIYIMPVSDTLYKLSGKNACAVAESQTRVRIVHSLIRE